MKRGASNLVDKNPEKSCLDFQDNEQRFLNAVCAGDINTFELLLNQVNVNCTSITDDTALMLAISCTQDAEKQRYIFKKLLRKGANTHHTNMLGESALSLALKRNNSLIIDTLQSINYENIGLLDEIWLEIAKYLGPNDLDNFRLACAGFQALIERNSDLLWQPLLNRLHQIDATISCSPTRGKSIRETFIEGFNKLKELHFEELEILDTHHSHKDMRILSVRNKNDFFTIEELVSESNKIDEINCRIIQNAINNCTNNELSLSNLGLTRFPSQILEGNNRPFFVNLKKLRIEECFIRILPSNIDICQSLVSLYCDGNRLISLPESLGNIISLKRFSASDNELTSLPKSFGNLKNLVKLYCTNNYITTLTDDQISIWKNQNIHKPFSNNLIFDLPETAIKSFSKDEFYSFLISQRIDIHFLESKIELHNIPQIWNNLLACLDIMDAEYQLSSLEALTLRDQFVYRFTRLAKLQAGEVYHALKTNRHAYQYLNYYIVDFIVDKMSGEVAFKEELELEKLLQNHSDIETFKTENIKNMLEQPLNQLHVSNQNAGIFHLRNAGHNAMNVQTDDDAMDIDEPNPINKPRK